MFRSEGYLFIAVVATLAAAVFAAALRLRSWALWLVAFVLTVGTVLAAWWFRAPIDAAAYLPFPAT